MEMLATNTIRSQLTSLIEMYKANIVSYIEASNKKKENPPIWLTNPTLITATSTVISSTLALTDAAGKLKADEEFIKNANHLHNFFNIGKDAALTGLTALATTIAVPVAGLAAWWIVTLATRKIKDSEFYKQLDKSKEINLACINSMDEWRNIDKSAPKRNVMNKCSLSENPEEYWTNFSQAKNLIDKY
jgi:hypothetical protein